MDERVLKRFTRRQLVRMSAAAAAAGISSAGEVTANPVNSTDLPILEILLDLHPELQSVVDAARLAKASIPFPIQDRNALSVIFELRGGTIQAGRHLLTIKMVEKYLPESFFPIENDRDLVARLLIGFRRGEMQHAYEASRRPVRTPQNATQLRGPWLDGIQDYSLEGWR